MICWEVFAHVTRDLANFRFSLKFCHSQFFDFHGSGTRLSANILPPYLIGKKTIPQGFLVSIREGRGEKGGGERGGIANHQGTTKGKQLESHGVVTNRDSDRSNPTTCTCGPLHQKR